MAQLFTNNATSSLANAINASSTTMTLQSGTGSRFPAVSIGSGDFFLITLFRVVGDVETDIEIVRVNSRNNDTLTVSRAQEGTVARAYDAGTRIELRVTADSINTIDAVEVRAESIISDGTITASGQISSGGFNTTADSFLGETTFDGTVTANQLVSANMGLATTQLTTSALSTLHSIQVTNAATFKGAATFESAFVLTGDTIQITEGGTGAKTAADARTNLDVYSKTESDERYINNTDSTLTLTNNLSVTGANGISTTALSASGAFALSGDQVQVSEGGTGASTAAAARTNLGTVSDTTANGIAVRTAANMLTARNLSSGSGISITNSDGVDGNPQITNTGVLSFTSGTGLSTNSSANGNVSVTNTDRGSAQNIFKNIANNTGTTQFSAGTNDDTIRFAATGTSSVSFNSSTKTITISSADSTNGTVTSVAIEGSNGLSVTSGSPITSSGTIALTTNATSSDTASTIVARDANRDFSARNITATLKGNADTATTATNVSGSGTISTTTGSFSGVITSTVANGTAPFSVSSTTRVANLNVASAGTADTAGSATTATTATNSNNVAIGTVSDNVGYPLVVAAVSGTNRALFVDSSGGTYNPSTNTASINITGSAGSVGTADNATNATNADNVAIANDGTSTTAHFITFVASSSGDNPLEVNSSRLTFVPNTGVLSATKFSGDGSGLTNVSASSFSGTLPIANGGTNSTATPTSGGVAYGTGTAYAFTAAGTTGQVLTSNGGSAPTWANAPSSALSVADDTTTDATRQILFTSSTGTSGSTITSANVSTGKLRYNPATGAFSSTALGIGVSAPRTILDVVGASKIIHQFRDASNNASTAAFLLGQDDTTGNTTLNNQANAYLRFATNNSERCRITPAGRFLLNRTTDEGSALFQANGNIHLFGANGNGIRLAGTAPAITLADTDANSSTAYFQVNGNTLFVLRAGADAVEGGQQQVDGQWPVQINLSNNDMLVGGNFTAVKNVTAFSDERLKADWCSLAPDTLSKLATVKCGTYTRIDNGIRQVGVSAQHIREFMPEAVDEDKDGYLSVAYGQAALALCVELAKEVERLKQRVAELGG